jgi:preprotein translocase subunit YajC
LQATVVAFNDDTVDLEIAPGIVTTWMKLAIRDRILPEDAEDFDETDGLDDSEEFEGPADSTNGSRVAKDS